MLDAQYLQRAHQAVSGVSSGCGVVLDRGASAVGIQGQAVAGWWCRPGTDGLVVLPNPWDDRALVAEFDRRAWDLAALSTERLGAQLNDLHAVSMPPDYWELLLAPWMLIIAAVLLDRQLFLETVREVVPEAEVLAPAGPLAPAPSIIASVHAVRTDGFNRLLMRELAAGLGMRLNGAPAHEIAAADIPARRKLAPQLVAAAANAPHVAGTLLAHTALARFHGRRLALIGLHGLSFRQLAALARTSPGVRRAPREVLLPGRATDLAGPPGEHPDRQSLIGGGTEEMAAVLATVLPRLIPRSVVEGYGDLVAASRRRFGPAAHVLHGNYSFDDEVNEFAARSVALGKRIGFAQHGGCADTLVVAPAERLEQRPDSIRLTWGGSGTGLHGVPSPYVQRLAGTHRGGDPTVIVESLTPPDSYVLRFSTVPLGNQVYAEQDRLVRFVDCLDATVRPSVVLKRFPGADAASARPPSLARLPTPRRLARRPATAWMQRARVAVVTYPDTPFIEAMVIGVPVIGLWSRERWGMRADAAPVYDALAELGVVHDDPQAAAAMLSDVYPRAASWWGSPEVVAARSSFLERFAMIGDWLGPWSRAANEICRG